MTLNDVPTLALGLTVTIYWGYVGRMVQRVRRDAGRVEKVLVPAQPLEKLMMVIWVPVIIGWMFNPIRVAFGYGGPNEQMRVSPAIAASGGFLILRFVMAGVALGCLALSIKTWRHMGEQWRMGIDPTQKFNLLVDGPFARVRHPIYALSILLMICSVVILPCNTMFVLAAIHIVLMHIKARNEERFLLHSKGQPYADYCRRTGRFLPFGSSRLPSHIPFMDGTETAPDRPIRGWKEGGQYPFRLNFFQQSMLRWDKVHPYNAVHAVRVLGPANLEALRGAAWDVSVKAGLGEFAANHFGTAYEYRPLQTMYVQEVAPGEDAEERLTEIVSEEINAGFPAGMHHPIRWTVFNEAGGEAHYIVLCYHHAISDAFGIEWLLMAVLRRYLNLPADEEDSRLTTRLTDSLSSLSVKANLFDYWLAHLRLSLRHRETRKAHRMPDERFGGDYTAVAVRTAPEGLMQSLSESCKRRGIGINDALLAAFTAAIAEQTPDRRVSRRRRRITMATVVSARKYLPASQAQDFGVCLTSIVVVSRRPDDPLEELAKDIARKTKVLKTKPQRAAAETALRYFSTRWMWWLATVKYDRRNFRRVFPICGGLSTFIVDQNRLGNLSEHVTRYIRACPAGPAMPLLLGPTVLNGRLELGLTYRIASRTREQAEAMLDTIVERLVLLAEPATAPQAV